MPKSSIFDFNLLTRNVKNFVRQTDFCFFKQTFERKKFSALNKKFPAYIKERKKCSANETFTQPMNRA